MTASASLLDFINTAATSHTEGTDDATIAAHAATEFITEFELTAPDPATGRLLASLCAPGARTDAGVIVVSPAAAQVGLYLLDGMGEEQSITCIDTEANHVRAAQQIWRQAGQPPARIRTLTARPLEVLSRMAPGTYQMVYADVSPMDLRAIVDTALPLLRPGGSLVLADALLDGTLADSSRTDRYTVAAREAFDYVQALDAAETVVTHLPLGAGLTVLTRK